jgi:uncharacterized protein DUF5615
MKIQLCLDEDTWDADLIQALRIRGVDLVTALEQGMIRRDDADHLELATSQGRVLYSFNVGDYQQLHTEYLTDGKRHSGIILAQQQRYNLGEQMRLKIIAGLSAEEMKDSRYS